MEDIKYSSERATKNSIGKKQAVVREIQELAEQTDYLSLRDYSRAENTIYKSGQGVAELFDGSWRNAKSAAGLKTKRSRSSETYISGEEYYNRMLESESCSNCGESYPAALDFHHKEPSEKNFTIGDTRTSTAPVLLKEESEKCVVLCRNCHAKHHDNGHEFDAGNLNTFNAPELKYAESK